MPPIDFNADESVKNSKTLTRVVTRDIINSSVRVFRDDNPMHTDLDYARSIEYTEGQKFEDTPVHGALIQSYFDLCAIQSRMMLPGSRFTMENPIYPDTELTFRLDGFQKGSYNPPQFVCETDKGVVARLNARPVEVTSIGSPVNIKDNWTLVSSRTDTITKDDVNDFYDLIGVDNVVFEADGVYESPSVPRALAFSLVPSSLIKLASDEKGRPVGIFKKMYPAFYRGAEVGDFQTDIYLQRERGVPGKYAYVFTGVCKTNNLAPIEQQVFGDSKVVVAGKASVASPIKIELESIAA